MQVNKYFSNKMFDCVANNTTVDGFLNDRERECPESGFDPYEGINRNTDPRAITTPIHYAAKLGKPEIVEAIAKLGGTGDIYLH